MERMAVNEGEKNTLYIVDRKAVDKCRKGKRIWVKHKREEKKKMKMLFRVRVTDEQRDELMWLKWMQRDWRSVCCVNGHEDKELLWLLWKLCPSNAQTSKAKLAPVCTFWVCTWERKKEFLWHEGKVSCFPTPVISGMLIDSNDVPRPYLPPDRKSAHFRSTTWFLFAVFKP